MVGLPLFKDLCLLQWASNLVGKLVFFFTQINYFLILYELFFPFLRAVIVNPSVSCKLLRAIAHGCAVIGSENFARNLSIKYGRKWFPHSLHVPAFLNVFILEWSQGILSWSPCAQRNGWRRADRTTTHKLLALCPQLLQLEDHPHISKLKLRLVLPQLVPQGFVNSPLTPKFPSLGFWFFPAMATSGNGNSPFCRSLQLGGAFFSVLLTPSRPSWPLMF